MNRLFRYLLPLPVALVLATFAEPSSHASLTTEVVLDVLPAGDTCRAVVGADGVDVLCANASGGPTVVGVREHPQSLACPSGGRAVSWGADVNSNGLLEPSELEGSTYVCRHARGASGGTRALVSTTVLELRNGHCPAGGALVQSGIDRDADGVLSAREIDRATFACNRFGGPSLVASVAVADELPGAACALGGRRIAVGHEGENPRVSYACDRR